MNESFNIPKDFLEYMERNWPKLGMMKSDFDVDSEYTETGAIEGILNEMIDYAINKGHVVRTPADSESPRLEITDLICE